MSSTLPEILLPHYNKLGEIFRTRPDQPWGPPTMGTGSIPGVKRPGRGADHPPPSSAEVKKG
jgi:hypothetical protein